MGRPAWVDERLFPFDSHYLEVEGARLHYIDEGEGPPVLMLQPSRVAEAVVRLVEDDTLAGRALAMWCEEPPLTDPDRRE